MCVACKCHNLKKKSVKSRRPMCAIDQGALRCPCRLEIQYGEARIRNIDWKGDMDLIKEQPS